MLPFLWAFGMLVYAILTRKPKRRRNLLMAAVALLYLFGNPLLFNWYARAWDINPNETKSRTYSAAILLGGFISQDENGKGFFNESKDRYIQATQLLANHTVSHLLMTGGNGSLHPDGFSEGAFVQGELRKMNFPDSTILIEGKSRNTFENASFSHKILTKAGLKPPYLLVTSGFHMRRALLVFKKERLEVIPYPCDYKTYKGPLSLYDLLPATETYGYWNLYIKEFIGYMVTMLK